MPYSCEQMFDLVADIRRYPEFLPWVSAMRVRSNDQTDTVADMIVGFKGLRESFTSNVRKVRPSEIHVDYVDGPLKYLRNDWHFSPDDSGCKVEFCVDFAFKNRMFEMLAGQVFGVALRRMIGAFEERAAILYGDQSSARDVGSSSSSAQSAA